MSGTRVLTRKPSCLVGALLLVGLFHGCSQSIKDVVISEESEPEITRRLSMELTVDEARLLHGYLVRTYPELGEGRLPAGRTLGEMIADQRAFERPAAENETPEGDETGDQIPAGGEEAAATEQASGTKKKDARRIGIATGIGAAVGAIVGGGKGAAIGTAIGAGGGTGVVVATPGENVEFEVEQLFEVALEQGGKMKILHD